MDMEQKKRIDENIRSGFLEILLLQLLSEGDMLARDIRSTLAERTGGAFNANKSAIYSPLSRMLTKGLISLQKGMIDKNVKYFYHIEKSGIEYLDYGKEQTEVVFDGLMKLLRR